MNLAIPYISNLSLEKIIFPLGVILVAIILVKIPFARRFPLIKPFKRFVIWSIAILLILDNFGYDMSTVIAGLGIGGLAIALGTQETLNNFFSSLMLVWDKPFKVHDRIKIKDYEEGEVLKIGFRTTILRGKKNIIIIPNRILVTSVIEKNDHGKIPSKTS